MIHINALSKRFGSTKALNSLDVSIETPGIVCVLGPNGSGKTTLIKCILGMVIPDSGIIEFEGHPIIGGWKYRERIDYLPQSANFPPNLTVNEVISLVSYLRNHRAGREKELIELFKLEYFLDKKIRTLSGGTRQKLNLLLALMFDNPLIVMDEPTNGLDPVSVQMLKGVLLKEKAAGKTILLTTHIMQFVQEMADEVIFMLDGRIHYKGSPNDLLLMTSSANLEESIAKLLEANV